jgi:methoxymalonate biosynthesis acyl carrier protein
METANIIPELRNYIRERFKVSADDSDFTDDVHLFDYGYVDSFGAVDLTSFVEEKFAIKISESDMVVYPLNTITGIATFVSKRKKGEV